MTDECQEPNFTLWGARRKKDGEIGVEKVEMILKLV